MNQYKIIRFSLFDSHKHGDILEKFCKFRYQGFIIEEKCDLPTYGDAEFDQYDNPFAKYITIMKDDEIVACSRINRTDIPYMAKDCYSDLIQAKYFPQSSTIYEWTREYISSRLEKIEIMKMKRILSAVVYFTLLNLKATGVCYIANYSSFNITKKLGMSVESVANFNLPNFPNIHFLHASINIEDAKIIARNLCDITDFDILEHFDPLD